MARQLEKVDGGGDGTPGRPWSPPFRTGEDTRPPARRLEEGPILPLDLSYGVVQIGDDLVGLAPANAQRR